MEESRAIDVALDKESECLRVITTRRQNHSVKTFEINVMKTQQEIKIYKTIEKVKIIHI